MSLQDKFGYISGLDYMMLTVAVSLPCGDHRRAILKCRTMTFADPFQPSEGKLETIPFSSIKYKE